MMPHAAEISPETTTIRTRFGAFDAKLGDVVMFPEGVPGFERCRRFVLLSSPALAPVQCLQALDPPQPSFLVIDPRLALPQFRAVLTAADRARLGDEAEPLWLALVTLDAAGRATVNLRAPIVIGSSRMVGYQLVPHRSVYPVTHPLEIG